MDYAHPELGYHHCPVRHPVPGENSDHVNFQNVQINSNLSTIHLHKAIYRTEKSKLRNLTEAQKEQNKKKSSVRVLVEHTIGGVKRLGIVSQVFRNKKKDFDDTVMLISCGLWNYHLAMS